ncbi:ABC transporter permease [Verrucomicrobiota bacterium sgz303538]
MRILYVGTKRFIGFLPATSQPFMRRYLEIYWLMVRNSLIREMSFKANFLLWMIVELLWFMGQIVFIEVLFQYVHQVGDWTKWEVVALVGTHQLIGQIFQAFFYVNLANLPELVRTGKLDLMLLLPVDAQFAVSTRQFGMDNIVNAGIGIGIVSFALAKLGITPAPQQIALYIIGIALGVTVHYSIMFTLATVSFWIVRAQGLIYGYFNLFNIGRYPDVVFRGIFKVIFSYLIPVIIVANVPVRMLTRALENPLQGLLQLAGAALFIALASRLFWTFALRRYSSASS